MNRTQDLLEKLKNKYGINATLFEVIEKVNAEVFKQKEEENRIREEIFEKYIGRYFESFDENDAIGSAERQFYFITNIKFEGTYNTEHAPLFKLFGFKVSFNSVFGASSRTLSKRHEDLMSHDDFEKLIETDKERFESMKSIAELTSEANNRILDGLPTALTLSENPII